MRFRGARALVTGGLGFIGSNLAQALVAEYMAREHLDLPEVLERREEGRLDPAMCQAIDETGGLEKLNRHVSGVELSWALRDYALMCWGGLARLVLRTCGVTRTDDFGAIVFALIESGRLQKESHDRLEDFHDVFDFQEALDAGFRIGFEG